MRYFSIIFVVLCFWTFSLPLSAMTCTESVVCTDDNGGLPKVIDGQTVSRSCWAWTSTKTCEESGEDTCADFSENASCVLQNETCSRFKSDGSCAQTDKVFLCDKRVDNKTPSEIITDTSLEFDENECAYHDDTTCAETSRTCLAQTEGVCSKLEIDFTCETSVNTCAILEALGCEETTENTYTCNTAPETQEGISEFNRVIYDGLSVQEDTCHALSEDATCDFVDSVCLELNDYFDCVKEQKVYLCQTDADVAAQSTCAELLSQSCELTQKTCQESINDVCVAESRNYACTTSLSAVSDNISFISETENLTSFTLIDTCELENQCSKKSRRCLDGPSTKTIGAETYFKDCWDTEITYGCTAGEAFDDCLTLENDAQCVFQSSECVATLGDICTLETKTYACEERSAYESVTTVCEKSVCVGNLCENVEDEGRENLTDVALKLEIARQASIYGDYERLRFFSGTESQCRRKSLGANCCSAKTKGNASNANLGFWYVFAMDSATEIVKTVGSPYVHDVLSSTDNLEFLLKSIYGHATDGRYCPSLSYYGVTATFTDGALSFSFSPGTFFLTVATQSVANLLACEVQEQVLAMRKGEGLCVYVGSACTEYNLGHCQVKTEKYCCFNSRLAKTVQEAFREQNGKGWGTFDNPDCEGLTQYEFMNMDLSKVSLDDFIDIESLNLPQEEELLVRAKERLETLKETSDSYAPLNTLTDICNRENCP